MLTHDSFKKPQNQNAQLPKDDQDELLTDQQLDNIYKAGSATTHLDGLRAVYSAGGEGKGLVNGGSRRELEHTTNQVTSQNPFPKPPEGEAISYDATDGSTEFVKPDGQVDHKGSSHIDHPEFPSDKRRVKGKSNETS